MTTTSSEQTPHEKGKLDVQLAISSEWLKDNLSVEVVRTSDHEQVHWGPLRSSLSLSPGTYNVAVVLEGKHVSKVVDVEPNETTRVRLSAYASPYVSTPESSDEEPEVRLRDILAHLAAPLSGETKGLYIPGLPGFDEEDIVPSGIYMARILAGSGREEDFARLEVGKSLREKPLALQVLSLKELLATWDHSETPTISCYGYTVSVPLSRDLSSPDFELLPPDTENGTPYPEVIFSQQRHVARNIYLLDQRSELRTLDGLLEKVVEMLYSKYKDASAAAYAALILHRFGRLTRYEEWLSNLANFSWIPDAKVLQADIALEREQYDEAHRLLGEVDGKRMIFTESFGIFLAVWRVLQRRARETDSEPMPNPKSAAFAAMMEWDAWVMTTSAKTSEEAVSQ